MRRATRATLALLGLCLIAGLAGGCTSAKKRGYLSHLSTTIEPGQPDRALARALADARAGNTTTSTIAAAPEE